MKKIIFNSEFALAPHSWLFPMELFKHTRSLTRTLRARARSRSVLMQGELGDCWLISAMSLAALHPEIMEKIFEKNPESASVRGKSNSLTPSSISRSNDSRRSQRLPPPHHVSLHCSFPTSLLTQRARTASISCSYSWMASGRRSEISSFVRIGVKFREIS